MRAREDRKKRLRERTVGGQTGGQNSVAGGQGNEGGEGEKRKSKKVEWQLRCKDKRLRRRETKKQEVDKDNHRTLSNPRNDSDGRSNRLEPVTKSTGRRLKGGKMANGTVKDVNRESEALVGVQKPLLVRKRSRGVAELPTDAVAGGGKRVKLSKKQSRNVSTYTSLLRHSLEILGVYRNDNIIANDLETLFSIIYKGKEERNGDERRRRVCRNG